MVASVDASSDVDADANTGASADREPPAIDDVWWTLAGVGVGYGALLAAVLCVVFLLPYLVATLL